MSQDIWTQCGGISNARALNLEPWRVVESQYWNSTRKLVDSDEEQAILEEMIDGVKPSVPKGLERLHYLLFTPFRHPPLRNGSRFGRLDERGIFYASVDIETACAEVAYYRLVFLEGSATTLGLIATEHTAFQVGVKTQKGIDLTVPPFSKFEARISSKADYSVPQQLGSAMRGDGIEAALFISARAPNKGVNVALFEPAFDSTEPRRGFTTWICSATTQGVEFKEKNIFKPRRFAFPRGMFLVKGALPMPAV